MAIQTAHRPTLSDETKKSGKKSRERTAYDPPFSTLINFFQQNRMFQKIFYEMNFDPSESDEPIFGGPAISEVVLLIEIRK